MSPGSPLRNIRVVLCETSHPGNIGAAARALKTMGLSQLVLVNPLRYPDPEAQWRASRSTDVLDDARVCGSLDEALAGTTFSVACSARSREIAVPAVTVRDAARQLVDIARAHPVALVFGNETSGLTTADVNKCRLIAAIPANPEYSSLNLAAAVQVFAYELRMAVVGDEAPDARPRVLASHQEVEGFFGHLESTLATIGFLDSDYPKKLMPRLRRLFARTQLETEEVNILRGKLKTLGNPKKRE